jgi:hypothetical protein
MTDLIPIRSNTLEFDDNGNVLRVLTPEGDEFEPTVEWISLFKDENGDWREDQPTTPAILICHTNGCHMNGVEVNVVMLANIDGVYRAQCGPCRNTPGMYEPRS